ncbi:thiamine pyrophosphate-binding protein [Actinomadura madurae]|uniref:thiamine pyrophosphate-binding protein n=1 Tax=Actinomadura madurae TaxID=1993 RepID=UPI0020D22C70|nr:thiamine pyrophosphate-binding protein [Actinomadura madurae]MCP9977578.1 thiamine pyrophosphate-binding protein [Actinomadura madurae]
MKAYQALAAELVEQGVHTAFGLMGDANMQFVAYYSGALGQRFVGATHEAGGVAAADGYFRMTGEVAFASVTHGPGITNTVTALTEAARNRSQIVVLTGDTPPVRTWTQMIDIGAVVAPTGAAMSGSIPPSRSCSTSGGRSTGRGPSAVRWSSICRTR